MSNANYYAATRWSPHDVQSLRPFWTIARCERWLQENEKHVGDRLVEVGWEVIGTLLDPADEAYVIHSPSETGFWANDEGWGRFAAASIFDDEEHKSVRLPLAAGQDARWMTLAAAEALFGRHPRNLDGNENDLPRIMATFQPQADTARGKSIIDIDGARDVDVTAKVLALSMSEIAMLEDDQQQSDGLVDPSSFGHAGPFRVEVVEAVKAFFGVEDLLEIEGEALERERALRGIEGAYKLVVVYSICDPEKMAAIDGAIEEAAGGELAGAGSFVGSGQRDLEFRFGSRAAANTALQKVQQLETERQLGIEGSVAVA